MNKMEKLAADVKILEAQLSECTKCGVCQSVCPLFAQTRREADVSRGKLALIKGLVDHVFDEPDGVKERLDRCLLCGSCAKGCPSGVDAPKIFLFAKSVISRYLGFPFTQKLLFRKILADPARFNKLSKTATALQPFLFKKQDNIQGTSCARFAAPLLRHRHLIGFDREPFHTKNQDLWFKNKKSNIRVGFFVGCLVDKAFPNVAMSVVDVLKKYGADLYVPQDQGCCGIPALSAGDMDSFEKMVAMNVALFCREKLDYLVTACATCSATMIKLWPSLIRDAALKAQADRLAEKTVDISWLMVRRFHVSPDRFKGEKKKTSVTYHDPCHLKKSLDIYEEPRHIIKASGGSLVEMASSDTCCGMGGSFNLKHYDLSKSIGMKKARQIMDTGCTTVATSCPACMMQLSDMLAKCRASIAVRHPIELFAESLNRNRHDSCNAEVKR